ncbi:MAG TPA: protein YgfX [Gammaproteobacteria bacterium]|nr:protein YgfX [Gammaproteobacteria bacterium]
MPIRLEIGRSLWLSAILLLSHAGALWLVILIPLPWWLATILTGALAYSLLHGLFLHALRNGKQAIVELVWDTQGRWILRSAEGQNVPARLSAGSYVSPYLVLLNFVTGRWWQRRTLLLLPDALDAGSFRRFRVRMLSNPDDEQTI